MARMNDGWHKVGDAKVHVRNNVIVEILMQDCNGNWKSHDIIRFNKKLRKWELASMVTVDALRSGDRRGTIAVGARKELLI